MVLCEDILHGRIKDSNLPFIILGDFNENVLDDHHPITDFMTDTFQCKQLVTEPTTDYGSALDLIFTNMTDITVSYLECPWSDHKAVCASVKCVQ